MYHVNDQESQHQWEKKNLVTLSSSRKKQFDEVECRNCGIKGRRYTLGQVAISENYSQSNSYLCKNAEAFKVPKKVKVIKCDAVGSIFENLKDGSEHDVVSAPQPYRNDHKGVWVMGVGEPVKLLTHEFKVLG